MKTLVVDQSLLAEFGDYYRTMNGAISACPVGGTVIVREGTYRESIHYQVGSPKRVCALYVPRPMTIKAWPGEHPIITYDPKNPPKLQDESLGYTVYFANNLTGPVTLEGLRIVGSIALENPSVRNDNNVAVMIPRLLGSVLTIRNCDIGWAGHCGIKLHEDQTASILIDQCTIHDCGRFVTDHGIYATSTDSNLKTIRDCTFRNNSGYGIHLYAKPNNWVVDNCVVTHNRTGGILLAGSNNTIRNCSVVNNKGHANLFIFHYLLNNLTIERNIFAGRAGIDILVDGMLGLDNVMQKNAWHTAGTQWIANHQGPSLTAPIGSLGIK